MSKKIGVSVVGLDDVRPIVIKPHMVKICEKAIMAKLKQSQSDIL